jgi:hypothetical protein
MVVLVVLVLLPQSQVQASLEPVEVVVVHRLVLVAPGELEAVEQGFLVAQLQRSQELPILAVGVAVLD